MLTQNIYSLVCAKFSKIVVYFISVLLAIKYYSLFFQFIAPMIYSKSVLSLV